VELRSHPAIVLFAPSGYDTVGDIKAEISCLHVAAPPRWVWSGAGNNWGGCWIWSSTHCVLVGGDEPLL